MCILFMDSLRPNLGLRWCSENSSAELTIDSSIISSIWMSFSLTSDIIRYCYHSIENRLATRGVENYIQIAVATPQHFLVESSIKRIYIIIKFAWKNVCSIWSIKWEVSRYVYYKPLLTVVEKNVHIDLTILGIIDWVTGHVQKYMLNDSRIADNFSLGMPKLFVIHIGQDRQ